MNGQRADSAVVPVPKAAAWGAVISMMLGVFALFTAVFLPPSVLTPIASDLGVSVGLAGQTVTATAALAVAGSLLIPSFTRRMDRRNVLFGLSVLLIASNLMVAFAPDFALLLLVAAVQVAIAMGAGAGGIVVNLGSVSSVFIAGGAVLVVAALFVALAVKPGTRVQQPDGLVREEATATLIDEISNTADYSIIRGSQAAIRGMNNSGEICHDH